MRLEGFYRLIDERNAVGEEKNALYPIAAHQKIGKGDDGARLAGAGRHHDQSLAVIVLLESLANPADRAVLVVTLDDLAVDFRVLQRTAGTCAAGWQAATRPS